MIDLSAHQLEEIIQSLRQRIAEGLAKTGQQVACLPAFLAPPRRLLQPSAHGSRGQALVVDAGGTNLRAAWVDLENKDNVVRAGPEQVTLFADRESEQVDRDGFFKIQADLVAKLGAPSNLPLGYCFSYPADIHPDGDATLLHWTKGITIPGMVGTRVGSGLAEKLAADGRPVSRVSVLNDTVASLMGGVWGAPSGAEGFIGLIAGTGTNMATFFPTERLTKLKSGIWKHEEMAVNLESGNFHPPHLCECDDAVDRESTSPGSHRIEKAVSGYYLPFVFEKICPGVPGFKPEKGSGQISDMLESGEDTPARKAARWLVDRSADLVAAGLAALVRELGVATVAIQAEGTLFWHAPGYSARVERTLKLLVPKGVTVHFLRVPEVNLVGAACAALS